MRKSPPSLPAALLAVLLLAALAAPAGAAVFLSELCDPLNNYTTDRFIEIYNSGPGDVDLTNWKIIAVANNVDANTWDLSGTIGAGQAKVAGSTAPVTVFPIHFASASWLVNYFNWNGKVGDGAKLVDNNNIVLDYVLAPGTLFENSDMVRNANITGPNPVFNVAEWTITPVTLATDASPGSHNGSSPPAGGPRITNIVTDPAIPASGDPVDVQASVVDTSGAVQAVTLSWGTAAGSLPNVIGMPLLADSTYRTSEPIPGQASGVVIYYRVSAEGASASSQSAVLSYTVPGGGTGVPPSLLAVGEMSDSTLLVFFSEPVDEATAEVPTSYSVGGLTGVDAVRDPAHPAQVLVTMRNIPPGNRTMTVNGVADLDGNVAFGITRTFNYVDVSIPPGYYDSAVGLTGSALRKALHLIIRNHTVGTYAGALTAFQTTDVKPNGKVWDMYSDVPGGTPPYEYTFGQTGQGGTEGLGYNREHSFPASWFNDALPMYSDLWILYPTDSKVNGYRANYPYGKVGTATTTSLNGSKLGPSVSPGYTGTVFEPIDGYKGDLARGAFYVATRYLGQDGGWPGSPSTSGANLLPWAVAQYHQWSDGDPVSWKERMRNGAIWVIQHNRNPFVDHPEFVAAIYDTTSAVGVGDPLATTATLRLRANVPNPFQSRTTLVFDLARRGPVTLRLYDVRGRVVRTLAAGEVMAAGNHHLDWNGEDDNGSRVPAGLYFCNVEAGAEQAVRRVVVVR
jgi:endonuclease I